MKCLTAVNVFIFLLLTSLTPAGASTSKHEVSEHTVIQWTTQNGLSSNSIRSIIQHDDQSLWICTRNDVMRFNGSKFEVVNPLFDSQNTIRVLTLFQDNDNNMWIGHEGGVVLWDGTTSQKLEETGTFKGKKVRCIIQDNHQNIWIVCKYDGLFKYKNGLFTSYGKNEGLDVEGAFSIFQDSKNNLWIGSINKGLFRFSSNTFSQVNHPELSRSTVYSIFEDSRGMLWVSTFQGLFRIEPDSIKQWTESEGLHCNTVYSTIEAEDNTIWVATDKGINRIKNGTLLDGLIDRQFSNMSVIKFFSDKENNIWVATDGDGLFQVRKRIFCPIQFQGTTENESVITAMALMDINRIALGNSMGKVQINTNGIPDVLFSETSINRYIKTLTPGENNSLWAGMFHQGLYHITKQSVNIYNSENGLPNNSVLALKRNQNGVVWIGTARGLFYMDNDKVVSSSFNEAIGYPLINCIHFKSDDTLWLGTSTGLFCIKEYSSPKPKVLRFYDDSNISSVYEDMDNTLWICSNRGLIRKGQGKDMVFNDNNGLRCNVVYQILEDEHDEFWITSERCVLKVSRHSLNDYVKKEIDTYSVKLLDSEDGLESTEFVNNMSQNSILKTPSGALLFSTIKGIFITNPAYNPIPEYPAVKTIIKRVKVDGRTINRDYDHPIPFINPRMISITLDSSVFAGKNHLKYRIMLEGVDNSWKYVPISEDNEFKYNELPSGTYTFKVSALNKNSIWNENVTSFSFKVLRPFHWAYGVTALLIISLIILAAFYSRKQRGKNSHKERQSRLNITDVDEKLANINYFLEVEKVYRDEELSLRTFAEQVNIPSHQCSQLINEHLGISFSDLINKHRINEVKKRLKNPDDRHLNIIDIAMDAGYNSKAVFNRAFKTLTGTTPSDYRKKHLS